MLRGVSCHTDVAEVIGVRVFVEIPPKWVVDKVGDNLWISTPKPVDGVWKKLAF